MNAVLGVSNAVSPLESAAAAAVAIFLGPTFQLSPRRQKLLFNNSNQKYLKETRPLHMTATFRVRFSTTICDFLDVFLPPRVT